MNLPPHLLHLVRTYRVPVSAGISAALLTAVGYVLIPRRPPAAAAGPDSERIAFEGMRERTKLLEDAVGELRSQRLSDTSAIAEAKTAFTSAVQEVRDVNGEVVRQGTALTELLSAVKAAARAASLPDAAPDKADTAGNSAAAGKVKINSAPASAFDALPGIGPAYAERIVAYRNQHGPFLSVEALSDVPGIGEATVAKLRPLVEL